MDAHGDLFIYIVIIFSSILYSVSELEGFYLDCELIQAEYEKLFLVKYSLELQNKIYF